MTLLKYRCKVRSAFIIFVCLTIFNSAEAADYVTIQPKNGDAVMSLFKKYRIAPSTANLKHYKEINGVKKLDRLLMGKNYKLPILKIPFDGKSIATSIPSISKVSAKSVMVYNNTLFKNQLRKKPYTKNKVVWIVYDEWYPYQKKVKSIPVESKTQKASFKTSTPIQLKTQTKSTPSKENIVKAINSAPALIDKAISKETKEAITSIDNSRIANENAANLNTAILRTKIVPIFGPDFQEIRIQTETLKNKVYYLVSGHGGPDPGTMFHGDNHVLCEDEYAYDVTLRLARKLMEQSARVYLIVQDPNDGIRNETYLELDKDERCITGFPLVLNQRLRLTQTTDATNDLYRSNRKAGVADRDHLAVHIHVDSRAKDMRKDVYFYYQENNKVSEAIARNLQRSLDKKYQEHSGREYTGTISCRNLFVMRNTLPSTVYMELGNIQNNADQKRLLFSSNRQALAEWLYSGIAGE